MSLIRNTFFKVWCPLPTFRPVTLPTLLSPYSPYSSCSTYSRYSLSSLSFLPNLPQSSSFSHSPSSLLTLSIFSLSTLHFLSPPRSLLSSYSLYYGPLLYLKVSLFLLSNKFQYISILSVLYPPSIA
jgi:hypothetical protein